MGYQRRIALVSEHASPVALLGGADAGGQNVYVDEVSRGLARLGYAVDIFTRCDAKDVPEIKEWATGVRIINVPAGPPHHVGKDELWPYMPTFRDAMLRFITAHDHHYDLLHGHFWMSGWVVSELQRLLVIPTVQIFHATGKTKRHYQGSADTSPDERISIEMATVRQVDAIIAQCPTERDELLHDYLADPRTVHLIPGAVNTHIFRPVERATARRVVALHSTGPLIVYVGRILPRKDVRNIIRALALLDQKNDAPPAELLIVGGDNAPESSTEMALLQHLAQGLGVEHRVHFAGQQQPQLLRYYYSAADVVVTTPWYEPFGLTPLEAMACERPVIGSAVGGLQYTIQHEITGWLVPPNNPAALAATLHTALSDPKRATTMGKMGRRRVEREFLWPIVAMRTAALYEKLLAERAITERPFRGKMAPTSTSAPLTLNQESMSEDQRLA